MWKPSFINRLKMLDSPVITIFKDDRTPIEYEEYNTYSYYYILNNNINMLYSDKELAYIIKENKDPFTRLPITSYLIVKIRFNQ